ncbi:hypothetical protein BGZ94_004782, partial [Podila epigama]
CLYPFHDKAIFQSSLVIQRGVKKRRRDTVNVVASTQQETSPVLKKNKTESAQPPLQDNILPHATCTAVATATTTLTAFYNLFDITVSAPRTSIPTGSATLSQDLVSNVDNLDVMPASTTIRSRESGPASPTAMPALSTSNSPELSLEFLDTESWMMPTTPPNMAPATSQLSKHTQMSSAMSAESIENLLFDDIGPELQRTAHIPDFGSLLSFDDASLDAFLGDFS